MHALQHAADSIPLSGIAQYGAAGAIGAILIWFGWQVIDRERTRADKNEAEVARLNGLILDRYVGSLEQNIRVLEEVKDLLPLFRDAPPPRRRP